MPATSPHRSFSLTACQALHHDANARADIDYCADLDRIRAAGVEYAANGIAAGDTTPSDGLFSGEWSDGLTGQDALNAAGINALFDDLTEFEREDVLDAFEDGYYSAEWPNMGNAS